MQGEKKPLTLRIPKALKEELDAIAKISGRNLTDLILTVLDQFAQGETKNKTKV